MIKILANLYNDFAPLSIAAAVSGWFLYIYQLVINAGLRREVTEIKSELAAEKQWNAAQREALSLIITNIGRLPKSAALAEALNKQVDKIFEEAARTAEEQKGKE